MSGARGVCRPGSHCAVRRSNRDGSRCAELCVLEARPPGTWGCGCLWGLKGGCGWLRVESGLRERSWARTQELGASGCCQVRVSATSVGGSEPFGALIFLFQLAGQTCIPVNRWAGHGWGGRASGARAPCLPITAAWAGPRLVTYGRAGEDHLAPPPLPLARALASSTPPRGGFQEGRPSGTCSLFHAGGMPAVGKPCVHRRASAKLERTFQKCFW